MLRFIFKVLYIITVFYEALLGIRFLFKMIHIPASVHFANWVYTHTDYVINLFSGANMPNIVVLGFFVEINALLAIVLFTIINWSIAEIIKIFK